MIHWDGQFDKNISKKAARFIFRVKFQDRVIYNALNLSYIIFKTYKYILGCYTFGKSDSLTENLIKVMKRYEWTGTVWVRTENIIAISFSETRSEKKEKQIRRNGNVSIIFADICRWPRSIDTRRKRSKLYDVQTWGPIHIKWARN